MYNIALSSLAFLIVLGLISLIFPVVAGILPALAASAGTYYFIAIRIGRLVEEAMRPLPDLLQQRKVAEAQQLIVQIRDRWSRWQPLLAGQLDAQIGLIDYMQMKWDDAMPNLARAQNRNWMAQVCVSAILHRKGEKSEAYAGFEKAQIIAPKEPMVYLVPAVLRHRDGALDEALQTLSKGIEKMPESQLLSDLKNRLANKKRVDIKAFPQTWYQFFPEDAVKMAHMRGRDGQRVGAVQPPPTNRKMRRSQS